MTQGCEQRTSNLRLVKFADWATRRIAKPPADDRNRADQHLRPGERLVLALSDGETDGAPAGGLTQVAPLPELRKAAVRSVLDEGVPGIAVGDVEGLELRHR